MCSLQLGAAASIATRLRVPVAAVGGKQDELNTIVPDADNSEFVYSQSVLAAALALLDTDPGEDASKSMVCRQVVVGMPKGALAWSAHVRVSEINRESVDPLMLEHSSLYPWFMRGPKMGSQSQELKEIKEIVHDCVKAYMVLNVHALRYLAYAPSSDLHGRCNCASHATEEARIACFQNATKKRAVVSRKRAAEKRVCEACFGISAYSCIVCKPDRAGE